MKYWNQHKQPPKTALKQIKGGRMRGMTDISPQWRLKAMTEIFGPVGTGWKYEIVKKETMAMASGEILCFVDINLYYKDGEWSEPIPGTGGNFLVQKEKGGLHVSDEGYKMALTDALSVAMKAIGIGADVYMGAWDGTKYKEEPKEEPKITKEMRSAEYWIKLADKEIDGADGISSFRERHNNTIGKCVSKENWPIIIKYLDGLYPSLVKCPESKRNIDINKCIAAESDCKEGCTAIAQFRGEQNV